jgi:Tfp pilus assembly protein PilE
MLKSKNSNQSGFGTLELMIVVIVLGMVGYATYYLYQRGGGFTETHQGALLEAE